MKKFRQRKERGRGYAARFLPALLAVLIALSGCTAQAPDTSSESETVRTQSSAAADEGSAESTGDLILGAGGGASSVKALTGEQIPSYEGDIFVEINGNVPSFDDSDFTASSFETYSELDSLGRCGPAFANIGRDLMPTEERGSIGQVKPSGWHTVKYDIVDGKYLYNRCHLIGYQLSGENANERNLITGTRYFNVEGMLPFENMVADYVRESGNHVLYRVTPVFEGDNLVASGVQIEACSVEDRGEEISFNVFVFNVQPGITIDYATGESSQSGGAASDSSSSAASSAQQSGSFGSSYSADSSGSSSDGSQGIIRGNSRSKIYHCPGQADYEEMADSEYLVIFQTEQEAISAGYRKAKR